MIRFSRQSRKAIILGGQSPNKLNWYGSSLLNTGVVEYDGKVHLYFRGHVGTDDNVHAVGLWRHGTSAFDPYSQWEEEPNYILHPDDVDFSDTGTAWGKSARRLSNPEACVYNNEVYLYTILKGAKGTGHGINAWPPTLLWKSSDGLNFTQIGLLKDATDGYTNTIHTGGMGVTHDGEKFVMLSAALDTDGFGFGTVVRTSFDGLNWTERYDQAFPMPDTILDNDFDDESWVTARMYVEGDHVYAFIPGGGVHKDYPEGVGLWRQEIKEVASKPWEEYSQNPILMRGPAGSIDEGAIWSPSVIKLSKKLQMFYEGCGAYAFDAGSPESIKGREKPYGGYGATSFSSICHAQMVGNSLGTIWDRRTIEPGKTYRIQNFKTGLWLRYRGTENGEKVETTRDANSTNLDWIVGKDNEFFIFRCAASPKHVLENPGRGYNIGQEIGIWTQGTGDNRQQEWHLEFPTSADSANGPFVIRNRHSGLCLSSSASKGSNVANAVTRQMDYTGKLDQQWHLIGV